MEINFITLEGIDGIGKSTRMSSIKEDLTNQGKVFLSFNDFIDRDLISGVSEYDISDINSIQDRHNLSTLVREKALTEMSKVINKLKSNGIKNITVLQDRNYISNAIYCYFTELLNDKSDEIDIELLKKYIKNNSEIDRNTMGNLFGDFTITYDTRIMTLGNYGVSINEIISRLSKKDSIDKFEEFFVEYPDKLVKLDEIYELVNTKLI